MGFLRVLLISAMALAVVAPVGAEELTLTRALVRVEPGAPVAASVSFVAQPGVGAVLASAEFADLRVRINGTVVEPRGSTVQLEASNTLEVEGMASVAGRVRVTQNADVTLQVLGRIHFNTNVSSFEQARAFYGQLGFETLSGFPDANTVAMARAIGIEEPTAYDGSQGGEAGGYLLHGELIGLGFNSGVIDLIEFTIPRNDEPPYPALNRIGMARAVFETADLDQDYGYLRAAGVNFLSPPVETAAGVRFAVLTDLDGTFYELREVAGEADEDAPTSLHRVGAVVLNVSDLERSLAWYRMLGFEVLSTDTVVKSIGVSRALGFAEPVTVREARLVHREDRSEIELAEWLEPYDATPPFPAPINHLGIHRMAFTSADIESDVAQLEAQGVRMMSPITPCCSGPDAWGSIVAFYDPDGIIMELAEMPGMTWITRLMNLLK